MSSIAYLENSLHSWEKEGFGEFFFMLGRLGFLLAASVAAYAVKRPKTSRSKPSVLDTENGGASTTAEVVEAAREEQDGDSSMRKVENEEEQKEAEEVKTISSFINATLPSNAPPGDQLADEKLLPEFESLLLSGEMDDDFPLPENKYDVFEPSDDAPEVERLRRLVKELEERLGRLEGELLVYYALEEDFTDLQKQLRKKTEEVEMLNTTIRSLREEAAAGAAAAAKELEVLRSKNEELQIQLDAGATSGWTTPW
ncbi:protein CHUP1, chloroplastic [Iris pallida]|uniref:Protein CHUP1, chloroplastic n=2 Tax=Iris pallida TaxID=29817 RepID=A0AAX6IFD7_IRIPA|nr:protein CHUP1, chloroplastic [Iris pallida]KAJ6851788.1 protein CHUP1, chloroplastic [Iris pallida]